MSEQGISELVGFHRFVGERTLNGATMPSPEEVLDEWRSLHPDPQSSEDDLAAIQEAIDDMEKGDLGIPFEEFDREFRVRHNLPINP